MPQHNIPDDEVPNTEPPPSYEDSLHNNNTSNSIPAQPPRPNQPPRPSQQGPLNQLNLGQANRYNHSNSGIGPNNIDINPIVNGAMQGAFQGASQTNSQTYSQTNLHTNTWAPDLKSSSANSTYLQPQQANQSFPPPPQRPPQLSQLSQLGQLRPQSSDLYTNNTSLPFTYPSHYFCNKCKNTGFKEKGKPCMTCWDKHFKQGRYEPNPKMNFRYPEKFICKKCANTGVKWKNGRSCSDCLSRYGPRNRVQSIPSGYGTQTILAPPIHQQYGNMHWTGGSATTGPPLQVLPGDPRLGGILCGNCRGTGQTRFFLDTEICMMCRGLGRIVYNQY